LRVFLRSQTKRPTRKLTATDLAFGAVTGSRNLDLRASREELSQALGEARSAGSTAS
jgi:hypothetical protein